MRLRIPTSKWKHVPKSVCEKFYADSFDRLGEFTAMLTQKSIYEQETSQLEVIKTLQEGQI